MRKLFSLFVVLIATTSLWAYDFQSGDLYYNITSSSAPYAVEVTHQVNLSFNYTGLSTATIPETVTYNGTTYSVTSIGEYAFRGCSSLTSITIPNSVTSIGEYAFDHCSSLTSITIPNSVTSIGYSAFSRCSSLTSITIPNGVTSIGEYAFYYCSSLTSITIPNSVTSIGDLAFSGCDNIKTMVVRSGNTVYDSRNNCNAIIETATNTLIAGCQNTIIPSSVTSIGQGAFFGCSSLTSITIPNGVTSIGYCAFSNCSSLTSITIPNSVTSIGEYAFSNCSSLTSITIPNSVTSIGNRAFYDCSSLVSVTMLATTPPSVGSYVFDSIASDAVLYILDTANKSAYQRAVGKYFNKIETLPPFSYTLTIKFYENRGSVEFLQQPDWDKPAIVKATPKSGYVFGCWDDGEIDNPRTIYVTSDTTMWLYFAPTSGECGDNLTWKYSNHTLTISGTGDMWDFTATEVPWGDLCGQIHNISLPTGITSIANNAFFACTEISSIILPSSLKKIGRSAFIFCKKLTSITIPDKVTTIGNGAFESCENLQHISIGRAVTDIGHSNYGKNDVFRNCTNLTSVEWNARECQDFDSYERTLFGHIASQITSFTFGKDVQYIPQYLCYDLKNITSVTIPNRVTAIASFAFEYCSSLSNLTIGGSVEEIGMFTFASCDNLTNVTIPDGVTSIGNYAFSDCKNLTSVSIGYGLKQFGYLNDGGGAFANCPKLTSVVWNAQSCADFEVGEEAPFYGVAQQITSFTFGNYVEHIPGFLCCEMKNLSNIQLPKSLASIGESAFESCTKLTSVVIPDNVTSIDAFAFGWCESLRKVTFGKKLQELTLGSFTDCTSIKEMISYASQVPDISYTTFDQVAPSTIVYVLAELVEQYKEDPYWSVFNIVPMESSVENIPFNENTTDPQKFFHNGQLYIYHNGKTYNVMGAEIQ